jgi:hypothetical protein
LKRLIPILIGALVYLVCSSRSCTEEDSSADKWQLDYFSAIQDSIILPFEKEQPAAWDLRTFEESAIQKLKDWADLMKVATDTALDEAFRSRAGEMAAGLFSTPEDADRMGVLYRETDPWYPDSIITSRLLARLNDTLFSGELKFVPVYIGPEKSGKPVQIVISINLFKNWKDFGTDRVRIWNVFLGSIQLPNGP